MSSPTASRRPVGLVRLAGTWLIVCLGACGQGPASTAGTEPPPRVLEESPGFAEVANILHANCADCHRPGGSAPFSLLTFAEVAPRAPAIAEAVGRDYMPPWLPVGPDDAAPPVFGENEPEFFAHGYRGARRLGARELRTLRAWAEAGAPRGDGHLPEPPPTSPEWELGPPDLVVEFPEFTVPARGRDIYRNLVVRAPVDGSRWIRTAELNPGAPYVVHHARMMVDTTDSSRRLEGESDGVGFDGMEALGVADDPPGFFVGWTPGKGASPGRPDLAWRLDPGTDLVLQLHLRPDGRERPVRARVGLYVAEAVPEKEPVRLVLRSEEIDVAPGDSSFVVEQSYRLPVPVALLGVYPHAHYLGKRLHGWATLPDGRRRWIIRIDDWDFDWQDDYRFEVPPRLPAGTEVTMRFTYDNSPANPQNPFDPPRRVVFGAESSDEMAELALQFLPDDPADVQALQQDIARRRYLAWSQEEASSHRAQGDALAASGDLDGAAAAYRRSLLEEDDPEVMAELGGILVRQGEAQAAVTVLQRALAGMVAADASHWVLLAEARVEVGELDGARTALDRAEARLASTAAEGSALLERIELLRGRLAGGGEGVV